jgi:hypothetical protein
MEGFSFIKPVTGLRRPHTGKEDDDDDDDDEVLTSRVVGICDHQHNSVTSLLQRTDLCDKVFPYGIGIF